MAPVIPRIHIHLLSSILIPLPENPTSDQVNEAESQARAIVDQARNGADFGKLAIAH